MKPNTEPKVQAYVHLIRCAEALHGVVGRGLLVEGLTPSQFSAMKVLRLYGRLAQRDIAKYVLKTGGSITMVVDNLEKAGLVSRDRDTSDRRVIYVSLTPEGEEVFDRTYPGHLDRIRESMATVTDEECQVLSGLLTRLFPEAGAIYCPPPAEKVQA